MPGSSTVRGDRPTVERVLRAEPIPPGECTIAPGSVRLGHAFAVDVEPGWITTSGLAEVVTVGGRDPGGRRRRGHAGGHGSGPSGRCRCWPQYRMYGRHRDLEPLHRGRVLPGALPAGAGPAAGLACRWHRP